MFHAAKPTTMMITRNTPPPLVGSKGKSKLATSTRADRASGGTIKIVSSNAISNDKIAATPASQLSFARRASTVTSAAQGREDQRGQDAEQELPRITACQRGALARSQRNTNGLQNLIQHCFRFFTATQRRGEARANHDPMRKHRHHETFDVVGNAVSAIFAQGQCLRGAKQRRACRAD